MSTVAEQLAQKQRDISVAEFFERNRHLLGFDNKRKALLTVVKEAVDNSIDACEEAKILPDISVEIIDMGNDRFKTIVEDNGPGIVKKNIPNVFAKLLYGSKFHRMLQQRGQQGIGISAAVLYAQLTTGRPARITSKTGKDEPAHYYELHIDTQKNVPQIIKDDVVEWSGKVSGVKIELDFEAIYQKGDQSVDAYLRETAITNPHATITYTTPRAEQFIFQRATSTLPPEAREIKPHPYGVEHGIMQKLLRNTQSRTMQQFLTTEFSRVSPFVAKEILVKSSIPNNSKPSDITHPQVEKMMSAIRDTKIMAPPTDCIVPIGAELLEKGLRKEVNAEFYTSITRAPEVYRGIPFVVECAVAFGGEQPKDESSRLLRYANRVPLLYQQGSCASFKAVAQTNWKQYGIPQTKGSLPQAPLTIVVHLASVWPPFTSEAKEAIAHYPEIIKEMKLAIQEVARRLAQYVRKKERVGAEGKKRSYIETYLPHVANALKNLLGISQKEESVVSSKLKEILEKKRGVLEKFDVDNPEYDEELASVGKDEIGADGEGNED
ncbi:DNA topoisomerase VI subunit B [Candidatus Woesearchaeota archaeon]|nr:DNA topoisomerase VI subunit B [Candidatus Woesearchaeota archaeon]